MIGGRILRKVGPIIFGRIRERVADRIEERFDESDPADATAGPPATGRAWQPPPWLALILRLLNALFVPGVPRR